MLALALDEGLADRLTILRLEPQRGPGPPAGLRYATEADVTDWATADD